MDRAERMEMAELILKDEAYAVIGEAIDVYRALGLGFLEKVYQEAMQLELSARKIPFETEKPIGIEYKRQCLTQRNYADLVCFEQIIVEMKTPKQLSGKEDAQILNYLRATKFKVGLLINFGSHSKLEHRQFVG